MLFYNKFKSKSKSKIEILTRVSAQVESSKNLWLKSKIQLAYIPSTLKFLMY